MDACPANPEHGHCWVRLDDPDRQDSPGLEMCALCQAVRPFGPVVVKLGLDLHRHTA